MGCGRGGLVERLHHQVALSVGLDADMDSLVSHRAPMVSRVAGRAEMLPFPDASFDLVLCSWVLEHLVRPAHAFAEMARVLKCPRPAAGEQGGHLILLTPNAWHPLAWANRLIGRMGGVQTWLVQRLYGRAEADTFPVRYRANTRRRVERLARAEGLRPVAWYTIGDPSYLAFNEPLYRLAVLLERLTPAWMKVHLVGDLVKE